MSDAAPTDVNKIRYLELLRDVRATGKLWVAETAEQALMLQGEKGEPLILVWSSEAGVLKYLASRTDAADFRPGARELSAWVSFTTPKLKETGAFVAANPAPELGGLVVSAEHFVRDLARAATSNDSGPVRARRRFRKLTG